MPHRPPPRWVPGSQGSTCPPSASQSLSLWRAVPGGEKSRAWRKWGWFFATEPSPVLGWRGHQAADSYTLLNLSHSMPVLGEGRRLRAAEIRLKSSSRRDLENISDVLTGKADSLNIHGKRGAPCTQTDRRLPEPRYETVQERALCRRVHSPYCTPRRRPNCGDPALILGGRGCPPLCLSWSLPPPPTGLWELLGAGGILPA